MNFRRGIRRDEPEINFIPLIDVLLVILIFLMVTTTYSKFTELQVDLPPAAGLNITPFDGASVELEPVTGVDLGALGIA